MGYVGEHLTLAGGGDYGDETVSRPIHFFEVLKTTVRWRRYMVGTGGEAGVTSPLKQKL